MRSLRAWLAAGWAATVLLPWYGIGGMPRGVPVLPAVAHGLRGGRPWLLPRRPLALVIAGAGGLIWLVVQGLLINHRGWAFEWIVAATGGAGPTQPALGWGAAFYALACLMLLGQGLARRGVCRGDVFVVSTLLLMVGLITLFVF